MNSCSMELMKHVPQTQGQCTGRPAVTHMLTWLKLVRAENAAQHLGWKLKKKVEQLVLS